MVLIRSSGVAEIFFRKLCTCTSTLRSNGANGLPSALSARVSLVTMLPALRSRHSSRLNSTAVSSTGISARLTTLRLTERATSPNCMDASRHFPRFKRFCKIVVRSNLQTDNAIHRLTHRAEKQDRHFGRRTQCLQKLQSRSTRKHDIKHDQFVFSFQSTG